MSTTLWRKQASLGGPRNTRCLPNMNATHPTGEFLFALKIGKAARNRYRSGYRQASCSDGYNWWWTEANHGTRHCGGSLNIASAAQYSVSLLAHSNPRCSVWTMSFFCGASQSSLLVQKCLQTLHPEGPAWYPGSVIFNLWYAYLRRYAKTAYGYTKTSYWVCKTERNIIFRDKRLFNLF
jgi:hypothetical protein